MLGTCAKHVEKVSDTTKYRAEGDLWEHFSHSLIGPMMTQTRKNAEMKVLYGRAEGTSEQTPNIPNRNMQSVAHLINDYGVWHLLPHPYRESTVTPV